jgi:MFS family permease
MNLWLRIFLPFALGYFLSYLLRNVNAVIAPELARDLAISSADLGLLTSAYLLAFGTFQLPLGILLDRYGPRRVETGLLLIAAAGCAAFALGDNLAELALARAAIGLGVCACLMASFKAFSVWFPAERLPSLNAAVMVAGSLGALFATTPLSWAVPQFGWRGVFFALGALTLLAAAGIFSTPDRPPGGGGDSLREQLRGLAGIVGSRAFWRFAPQTCCAVGGFMALQGLWAIPWLTEVGGYARPQAAFHMLLTTVAMMTGFLAIALFIVPLKRRGIQPEQVLTAGMGAGLVAMAGILFNVGSSQVLWFVLGMVFSVGNLAYALLAGNFPSALSGRANTALNLAAFVGAFSLQWGYGAALDALRGAGWSAAEAHRATFAALFVLQALSYAWFVLSRPKP